MQTAHTQDLKWNILKRIQKLPMDQISCIRQVVMKKTNCTLSKYYRVMQEKDNDVHVLIAFAEVLQCKVDDVLNPAYEFANPKLLKEEVASMTRTRKKTVRKGSNRKQRKKTNKES